jgi:hypothetical protein
MRLLFEFLGHRLDLTLEAILPELEEALEDSEPEQQAVTLGAVESTVERAEPYYEPALGFAAASPESALRTR